MLDPRHVPALRSALAGAGFTVDAVFALIGEEAHRALSRNQTVPARRATADGSPLATLVRLFSLQVPVTRAAADAALPGLVDPLVTAGFLATSADEVRALVDVRPYGDEDHDWWVLCDLTPGLDGRSAPMDPAYVLGISEASSSLARLTVREPVGSALDLGTGCGVQALHLAQHVDRVVATDVNPRALAMARLTAALNEVDVDVRDGSLWEPVAGERFDLVVTNPPFVVSPPGSEVLVYRDSGLPGDEVVRQVVSGAAAHLTEGGRAQVLANWVHRRGEPWQERLAGWLGGLDAWVLQREVADPPTYVGMWLTDAGLAGTDAYVERYDRWLAWFDEQGIEAVGFGWLSLRNAGRERPEVLLEEWTGPIDGPLGPVIAEREAALDLTDLMERRWVVAPDVVQETYGRPTADDPSAIVARRGTGVRRDLTLDTVAAGLLSACDGELTAGEILGAIGTLLDVDDPRTTHADVLRTFVVEGFLRPA